MAKRRNTTPVDSTAMFEHAKFKLAAIESLCGFLSDTMQEIHGGKWKAAIDHDCHFIMIRMLVPSRANDAKRPARGSVV